MLTPGSALIRGGFLVAERRHRWIRWASPGRHGNSHASCPYSYLTEKCGIDKSWGNSRSYYQKMYLMLHMGKKKQTIAVGRLLAIAARSGDFLLTGGTAEAKVKVATTIGMVADLVKQVGGERVEVEQLMGPGVDPHLYKPTSTDAAR